MVRQNYIRGSNLKPCKHHCLRGFLFSHLSYHFLLNLLKKGACTCKTCTNPCTVWSGYSHNTPKSHMAKIKLILDQRRVTNKEKFPVRFRIWHQNKVAEITTPFKASPTEFDERRECVACSHGHRKTSTYC